MNEVHDSVVGSRSAQKGRAYTLLLCGVAAFCAVPPEQAAAQARYDDHELRDRFKVWLGGFRTQDTTSTLRVDSSRLGIGTHLALESSLNVQDAVTGGRLDGYYRFNRSSRIEWTYYSQNRKGTRPILDTDIQIGDIVIPINYRVDSELDFDIRKVSYAWSFINTSTYEFFLGAGLNVRKVTLDVTGTGLGPSQGDTRVFETQEALPLPTLTAGMRYNVRDKLAVQFRFESFFLGVQKNRGRMQDTYLLLEYDFSKNFGIGGGLNAYNFDLEAQLDDGYSGQIESSYVGSLLYLTARF